MAYNRPEIVSKVTRLDKDFFENILDGVEERPTKAEADGTYAPAGPAVGVPKFTLAGSPVVVRDATFVGVAPWEYVHNGGTGYIYHIMMGTDAGPGSWGFGIAGDANKYGSGAVIVRNKAAGIGVKIEQLPSISDARAYGLAIEQNSALAPAVFAELKGESADLFSLVSYRSTAGAFLMKFTGPAGVGFMGGVQAHDGLLRWEKTIDLAVETAKIDARSNDTVAAASRHHTYFDVNGVSWARNAGAANVYYQTRMRQVGTNFVIEASDNAALGAATYEAVLAIGKGAAGAKTLAFFAGAGAARQTVAVAATDATTTQALANSIRSALLAYGLVI